MNQTIGIPIPNLPEKFTKAIHAHIRLYSVTMLMAESLQDDNVIPCSGTLCSFGSKTGIVTAKHVWQEARKHETLIVMTSRGSKPLKTDSIVPAVPKPTSNLLDTDHKIPDIAFLRLDSNQKAEIEGQGKVFYSVDKRVNSPYLNFQSSNGYRAIFGNPKERLRPKDRAVTSFVYGTGVRCMAEMDGWDYLSVDLNIPENPEIPKSFGGVSGGGVWRTMWACDSDQTRFVVPNPIEECVFVGVCFYETGEDDRRLIAHGPNSIYHRLSDFVAQTFP